MTAPIERQFHPLPVPIGNARAISAPFQFVTTGEDNLRVTVINSAAGCRVAIQGRRIDDSGTVLPMAWSIAPTADRSASTAIFPLGVGAIVNLTVWASSGSPAIGQTFVIAQLVRGREGGTELLGTLLQGYVTGTQTLGWPGSPIQSSIEGPGYVRQFNGTAPALGIAPYEVVPTGARWELLSAVAVLVTDATAIARTPRLVAHGPYAPLLYVTASIAQNATATNFFLYTSGFGAPGVYTSPVNQNPLPVSIPLFAGTPIYFDTLNFQPGDQWSALSICIREWLEAP